MAKKITQQLYNLTTRLEGARTKKAFALDVQKVMNSDSCDIVLECGEKILVSGNQEKRTRSKTVIVGI